MKRIGVLVPETNLVVEDEIYKLYEENIINTTDVIFHILRIPFKTRYSENDKKFLEEIAINQKEVIRNIKATNLDYLSSFCTSAAEIMRENYSDACSNSADSLVEAGKFLNIDKCLLITPYNETVGTSIENLLKRNGIEVVKKKHLDLIHSLDYVTYGYARLSGLIVQEYNKECKNVIISCTNLPTLHLINKMEKELDTIIISSNYSMFWKIFRDNNIPFDNKKMGRLFQEEA